MYIALYDENRQHLANVDHVTYDLTERVYDLDGFSAEGTSDENVNAACIAVLNDDAGNTTYACFADSITPDQKKRKLKGLDFKSLWDTEILLDFTVEGSFDGRLSAIFEKVRACVFDGADSTVQRIPVHVEEIPDDATDTVALFGSLQGTYKIVNAYAFLKGYLKYYEYNIETGYDFANGWIVFRFVKCAERVEINLSDFLHELTTTSAATNKTVATVKHDTENGARPEGIATKHYYRTAANEIAEGDAMGAIGGRLYPVRCKIFEAEHLSDAQFEAVNELANARYVDNIIIDHDMIINPLDLSVYPLYTKVDLYYNGTLYKTLPISEKITKLNRSGESIKIKLGFKKILLTEIIKAQEVL